MKRNQRIIIGIVAAVVLLTAIAAWFALKPSASAPMPAAELPQKATVTTLEQNLSLIVSGVETPVEKVSSAVTGDTVKTYETGRGLIQIEDGSTATLDYDSEVVISVGAKGESHTTLSLVSGQIWSRVQKLFGQGEFYEIKTQNAVAAVRGTVFNTSFFSNVMEILVAAGTVSVTPLDATTGAELREKSVEVHAGEKATVDETRVVRVQKITGADRKTKWFLLNVLPEDSAGSAVHILPALTPAPTPSPVPTGTNTNTNANTPAPVKVFSITSVTPSEITRYAGEALHITVYGAGFLELTALFIDKTALPSSNIKITSDSKLDVLLPDNLPTGFHDLLLVNIRRATAERAQAFSVKDAPPPEPSTQTPTQTTAPTSNNKPADATLYYPNQTY